MEFAEGGSLYNGILIHFLSYVKYVSSIFYWLLRVFIGN